MRVAVVGSGPAGVAAAGALLEGGLEVEMLDLGHEIEPEALALAERLRQGTASAADRARLAPRRARAGALAGARQLVAKLTGREALLDLTEKARLGSLFTFRDVDWGIPVRIEGRDAPVSRSLARGGLSNVWGAACYPLAAEDYAGWPLAEADLAPHYAAVARLLSLIQPEDALAQVYPLYGGASAGLPLNAPAALLAEHWRRRADELLARGLRCGRARLAVRAEDSDAGSGCRLCGLCLAGCPWDAIYRADWTLAELGRRAGFCYRPGLLVRRFREARGRVLAEVLERGGGAARELEYEALFLAAGTLSSLRIAAESQGAFGRRVRLLDNDVYLLPLLRTAGGRGPDAPLHFGLNELALRVAVEGRALHVQIYCLSPQVLDRVAATLPRRARRALDALRARLLLAFVYLPGADSARLAARVEPGEPVGRLVLEQERGAASRRLARGLVRALRGAAAALGLRPLGPLLRSTPAGHSGGHLAGGLPMVARPGPLETGPDGRLSGAERVYVVDGAALPRLPAQNSTFTLMANAHRIGAGFAARAGGARA
jgi:choline dehydrogenase-like flavoprotein